jgi:uncharacterized protein YjiS (DUF1127 family)
MSCVTHDMMTGTQAFGRPSSITGWLSRTFGLWHGRVRERQAFARLDYRDLRDIGLSRWEVERELVKPFWRG